jgi:ketosteroid isomerase-like protein
VGVRRFPVVLLAALTVTACGGSHVPGAAFAGAALLTPLSDAEEAHDALLRADLGRADSVAKHGYAIGLASSFANDVLYLRGGLPIVRGRAAAAAIGSAESLAAAAVRWQPVRAEVSADGRSGYSYGYTIYGTTSGYGTTSSGAPTIRVDRYIAFWRRDDAGWRIAGYAETYGAPPPALTLPHAAVAAALPDESMPRTRGPLESIRAADAAFSALAAKVGTGRAFGEYAAENAQIFSTPGEFITGPTAISAAFGPANDNNTLVWHPIAGEVAQSGDLGFTVGNAEATAKREDGTPVLRYSKYFTVWKKQRDGSWRYVVDGGSARPNE